MFIAAAIVIGFRYPVAWAFPLLTKVAPGVGLLWFVMRKEWRNLGIAVASTVAIAAVSAVVAPQLWHDWYDLLRRSITDKQVVDGAYIGIPVWLRLPFDYRQRQFSFASSALAGADPESARGRRSRHIGPC